VSAYQGGPFAGLMSAFPMAAIGCELNIAEVSTDESIDRYLRPIVVDPTGNEIVGTETSPSPGPYRTAESARENSIRTDNALPQCSTIIVADATTLPSQFEVTLQRRGSPRDRRA
jgi:hypothetical protein